MKKTASSTPHDAAFKAVLTHPQAARDFLDIHLPPSLRELCNLDSLQLAHGSFIEEDLRACYSDVLWSLTTRHGEGYVYTLIEHQSTPDRHMAFRLLRYAVAVMQRHLDDGHQQLPLVIPILFYHGQTSPYPYPMCWLQAFADPAVAQTLYSGNFSLVDVTVIPDDEIMRHRSVAMLELLQKHVRSRNLDKLLDRLVILLIADYTTDTQLITLINYMMQAGNAANPNAFIRKLAQRVPKHKEALMTIAQKLEQKGLKRGVREGIRLGKQEGKLEGKLEVARSLLKMGLPLASVQEATGLTAEALANIPH